MMRPETLEFPSIYEHPSNSIQIQELVKPLLPLSLAILRRIQHRLHTSSTHLLATFSPEQAQILEALPEHFAIGFLDRSASPGVASWIFWSGELCSTHAKDNDGTARGGAASGNTDEEACLLTLVAHMHEVDRPPAFQAQPTHLSDSLLFGVLHEHTYHALERLGLRSDGHPQTPAKTYLLQQDSQYIHPVADLPGGLAWDVIRERDFDAIIRSNPYVRSAITLRGLQPGVCVRRVHEGQSVAWGLLGMDGSVRTLHVEENYRRLGLGRAIVLRLMKDGLGAFGNDGLASTHIFPDNIASLSLFESLGFTAAWECYWTMVDMRVASKSTSLQVAN